jgi:hypothetical protein
MERDGTIAVIQLAKAAEIDQAQGTKTPLKKRISTT